ncbi:hypothetical protein MRB53_042324 [Persea americana]|nr:hypothetical protein MRB53_042324 [Persea americana]
MIDIAGAGQMTFKMPKRNSNLGPRPFPYTHPSRIMEPLRLGRGERNSQNRCSRVFHSLLTYPWHTFPNLSPPEARPQILNYIAMYSTRNSLIFGCQVRSPWYNISIPEDQPQPPVSIEERRAAYWRGDCDADEKSVIPQAITLEAKLDCRLRSNPDDTKKYQAYLDSDKGDRDERERQDARRRLTAVIVDVIRLENTATSKTSPANAGQVDSDGQQVRTPRTRTIKDYPQEQIKCLYFDMHSISMMDTYVSSPKGKSRGSLFKSGLCRMLRHVEEPIKYQIVPQSYLVCRVNPGSKHGGLDRYEVDVLTSFDGILSSIA